MGVPSQSELETSRSSTITNCFRCVAGSGRLGGKGRSVTCPTLRSSLRLRMASTHDRPMPLQLLVFPCPLRSSLSLVIKCFVCLNILIRWSDIPRNIHMRGTRGRVVPNVLFPSAQLSPSLVLSTTNKPSTTISILRPQAPCLTLISPPPRRPIFNNSLTMR